MSSKKELLMTICCLLIVPIATMAEDLSPPEWRGFPKSTVQEWDFMTADPCAPYLPDGTSIITNNPYGNAYIYEAISGEYLPNTGPGPGGAWAAQLYIGVRVCPDEYPYPLTAIRSQTTFYVPEGTPGCGLVDHGVSFFQQEVIPVPGYPEWSVLVTDWLYDPYAGESPSICLYVYGGPISEIVIDTIPEPATLLLLTLGACLLRKSRR